MAKFIATHSFLTIQPRTDYSAKFKQLFASLTGYDIMIEQSRKDLPGSAAITSKSNHALYHLLPAYISKFTVLFERESCNNHR